MNQFSVSDQAIALAARAVIARRMLKRAASPAPSVWSQIGQSVQGPANALMHNKGIGWDVGRGGLVGAGLGAGAGLLSTMLSNDPEERKALWQRALRGALLGGAVGAGGVGMYRGGQLWNKKTRDEELAKAWEDYDETVGDVERGVLPRSALPAEPTFPRQTESEVGMNKSRPHAGLGSTVTGIEQAAKNVNRGRYGAAGHDLLNSLTARGGLAASGAVIGGVGSTVHSALRNKNPLYRLQQSGMTGAEFDKAVIGIPKTRVAALYNQARNPGWRTPKTLTSNDLGQLRGIKPKWRKGKGLGYAAAAAALSQLIPSMSSSSGAPTP